MLRQVEDGERLGCASLASWSLKTYVATKWRIEHFPPRVDKNRGGAGERAGDTRNRTVLQRLRGNPTIKGLCSQEGVIEGFSAAPNNSVCSRTAIQSASGATNNMVWSFHEMSYSGLLQCTVISKFHKEPRKEVSSYRQHNGKE